MAKYPVTTLIEAKSRIADLGLLALVRRADLLLFFALRDIKVRYQQTFFGVLWALFHPLVMLGMFWLIFGRIVRVDTGGIPYPLFGLAGLILWNMFMQGVTAAANSLHNHQDLIKKIYFPRLILPFSAIFTSFIDFLIALTLLFCLLLLFGPALELRLLWIIPIVAITAMAGAGFGAALAALTVLFRDVRQIIPLIAQIGLLATPIAYPASMVPDALKPVYYLNPMAGLVAAFRAALLGTEMPPTSAMIQGLAVAVLLFVGGLLLFRYLERKFADIL